MRCCLRDLLACALACGLPCAVGCALEAPWPSAEARVQAEGEGPVAEQAAEQAVTGTTLRLATWNLTWFQDPGRPPEDEPQRLGAQAALGWLAPDVVGLQEIASVEGFEALCSALPEHDCVLGQRSAPQRLALLYRGTRFSLLAQSELLGLADAGRPPLEVRLFDHARDETLRVIVLHAKANAEPASYATRQRFAEGLRERLARLPEPAELEQEASVVLGDFNDGLERSIVGERASPYAALRPLLFAATLELELRGEASTVWGSTVDHVLVDRRLEGRVLAGSASVLREQLEDVLSAPAASVSDHYLVHVELR